MFYKCKKCNRVWQHPLKKCPNCFLELESITEKKTKVIGVSKVNIPTLLHPEVPYFVLLLEDENNNRWAHKSLKEYKIGDVFTLKPKRGGVSIWKVKYNILETIEKSLELIGGLEISKDSKVLILPTLISPKHPHFSENTSPQFLEATLNYLFRKGVKSKNIKLAAQSFNDFQIEASIQKSQLLRVCTENQIAPLDLSKTAFLKKEKGGISFEISKEVFDNNLIINLPILKIESEKKILGATDNTLKFLKRESYMSLKDLHDYSRLIEEFHDILPEHITVAEAISIKRTDNLTTLLGVVLASYNPFNLDRVFAEIAMVKDLPNHLKNIKIQDIPLAGRQIKEVKYDVERFYY